MEWVGLIIAATICLSIGFRFGRKAALTDVVRQEAGRAEDRAAFLHTVRRELGNLLMWSDPVKFMRLYKNLHAETSTYKSWKPPALQQTYAEIAKRYPQYNDFDVLGVRSYVLYPSARSTLTNEDLAGHYSDITRFVAVLAATDRNWKFSQPTSDRELGHLEDYAQRILDTKFKLRLQRAIQDFHLWRFEGRNSDLKLETRGYSVRPVQHFAENRCGVHLKDSNEYGLYGYFVHDDGRVFYSYYRSDAAFESEEPLHIDWDVFEYFGGVRD